MARLIDSSVFIEMERRGDSLYALQPIIADASFALSSITASELLFGVYRAVTAQQRQRRLEFVDMVLGGLLVLPFDLDVARTHARLIAKLNTRGKSIGHSDLMIAATALTYGYDVLTHNLRHFQRVPGLVVQRPDW